jgi:hypothetical protein
MSLLDEVRSVVAKGRSEMLNTLGIVEQSSQVQLIEGYAKAQSTVFLRSVVAEVLAGAAMAPPVTVAGFVDLLLDGLDKAEALYVAHHASVVASGVAPAAA